MELSIRELTTIIKNLDLVIFRRKELSIILNREDRDIDNILDIQGRLINQRDKLIKENDRINGRSLFDDYSD